MTEAEVEGLIYMVLRLEGKPLSRTEVLDRLPAEAKDVYNQRKILFTSLKDKGRIRICFLYEGGGVKWKIRYKL